MYEAQEELERQLREEEDRLHNEFQEQKAREMEQIDQEVENEWESRLKELTSQFDDDMTKKKGKEDKVSEDVAESDGMGGVDQGYFLTI